MSIELIPDARRDHGWWLLVDRSEQSFVDTSDPLHLEFEYVQMMAEIVETLFDDGSELSALHLGGGLCTVPRWLAARHPGSTQLVAEHSEEIADLSASIGCPDGVTVVIDDATAVLARAETASRDLIVCDLYDGPETVTGMFTLEALETVRAALRPGGAYLCNLSDAAPFGLARVVAATLRRIFASVVLLAEPAVLRGRRSGNLVLVAADREVPLEELGRRAASGVVRFRMLAQRDLADFIGASEPALQVSEIPLSGESTGRRIL